MAQSWLMKAPLSLKNRGLIAFGLAILAIGINAIYYNWEPFSATILEEIVVVGWGAIVVVTVGFSSYRDGSLVTSIALSWVAFLGFFAIPSYLRLAGYLAPQAIPWIYPIYTFAIGLIIGIPGHLLGRGYRRVQSRSNYLS